MSSPNLKNLSSLSQSELLQILGSNIVVLVGAGISSWEPTALPTSQDFTSGVNESIFQFTNHSQINQNDLNKLKGHLVDIPFELLMEHCPKHDKFRSILASLFSSTKPNEIHQTLSKLVTSGMVHSIITTNYDLALDAALIGTRLTKIVNESDVSALVDRAYFKIHGCAGEPDSMIFSLKQESAMPIWKQGLLKKIIENKVLLIIGYSGFDFEICPEIARISVDSIVWNFFMQSDYDRSPGFNYLKDKNSSKVVLFGDMRSLFSLVGHQISSQKSQSRQLDISSLLQDAFSKEELLLWRIRILNTMGNSRLALLSIKALQPALSRNSAVVLEYAQALFHNGKYLSAYKEFTRSAKLSSCPYEQINRAIDACDSLRCYGSLLKAHSLLKKINRKIILLPLSNKELKSRMLLKEILIYYDWYIIVNRMGLFFIGKFLREKAAVLTEAGTPLAIKTGRWLDFQQYMFWYERFNLDASIFANYNGFLPLPAKKGYKHLGYQVALLMEICDRAKQGYANSNEIYKAIETAKFLGSHPSCWKIAQVNMSLFPSQKKMWKPILRNYLKKCEYNLFTKIQFFLLGN